MNDRLSDAENPDRETIEWLKDKFEKPTQHSENSPPLKFGGYTPELIEKCREAPMEFDVDNLYFKPTQK